MHSPCWTAVGARREAMRTPNAGKRQPGQEETWPAEGLAQSVAQLVRTGDRLIRDVKRVGETREVQVPQRDAQIAVIAERRSVVAPTTPKPSLNRWPDPKPEASTKPGAIHARKGGGAAAAPPPSPRLVSGDASQTTGRTVD